MEIPKVAQELGMTELGGGAKGHLALVREAEVHGGRRESARTTNEFHIRVSQI